MNTPSSPPTADALLKEVDARLVQALDNFFQRSRSVIHDAVVGAIAGEMTSPMLATRQICLDWIDVYPDALSRAFADQFRRHLEHPETAASPAGAQSAALQLVDDDHLARLLAEEKATARLVEALRPELMLLLSRLQSLRQQAPDENDPAGAYGPASVMRALSRALDALDIDSKSGTLLLRCASAPLHDTLKQTYSALNQYLFEHGVQEHVAARTIPAPAQRHAAADPGADVLAHIQSSATRATTARPAPSRISPSFPRRPAAEPARCPMEREMPDNSVVINLNQFERTRRAQASAETLAILHASRDLLIEGATRVLTRQSEAMANALLMMADRSPLLDTRYTYYGAQGVLDKRGPELLTACKDAYYQRFSDFTVATGHSHDHAAAAELAELSLVGDQDFEITLAVDKATSRLRYNCAEELIALDARIADLTGRSDLAENSNPLGPRALCEALLDGIGRMQLEQNVRIVLLNQFGLVLTTELAAIYRSINRHLVEHGILPDLKIGAKIPVRNEHPAARASIAQGPAASLPGQTADDMLSLLQQLAAMGGGGQAGAAVAGSGYSLLDSLSQLQAGAMMLPDGVRFELPAIEACALQGAGTLQGASTVRNVLRSLQQSPAMQVASPLDAVLVDAVALLFDVVFEESTIPDRLKAQIARLQIPVLKAAMLDRAFFSQPGHPVRRMLDAIATLAVHLPDNAAGSARLEAISQVVSRVLDDFDQDIQVFDTAATELEAMGASLEETLEETAEASLQQDIDQIKQSERAELAPVVVHDFINRALKDQPVADALREFLRRDWAQLLMADYIRDGEQGARFNSHVETMRELVWSVQPKADMDARLMLVRILPGLLKRLREGVAEIDLPSKMAERFFATLVILHANAVRPHAQPVPLPEASPESCEDVGVNPPSDSAVAAIETEPEAEPGVPELEDAFTLRARALNKGDWVEFHYDDGTFRWARLGWVSGIRNTYLFSDQDGMNSFSIGLHRLADKLRRGEAVVVERKSITESAFGKLMNLFRQKLGGG